MKEIYKEIIKLSHDEGVSVLATVVRQGGPAPRGVGAKCLLRSDGTMAGSVGGGMLEAKTLDAAREVMKTGRPRRLGFSLKGTDVAETDMLCGGDVEVFLEPVVPSHAVHRALARELERIERRGGMGLLCTVLDTDQWEGGRVPRLFLGSDGRRAGDLDQSGGLERALQERFSPLSTLRRPGIFSLEQDSGTVEVYPDRWCPWRPWWDFRLWWWTTGRSSQMPGSFRRPERCAVCLSEGSWQDSRWMSTPSL